MELADASATVANALYKEWGLLGPLAGIIVPLIPAIWWLHRRKHDDVIRASLKIRVSLVNIFQRTVLEEAARFFKLVEGSLPTIIAKRVASKGGDSAFGLLCRGLRKLDGDPSEHEFAELLQKSVGTSIADEVDRILAIAASNVDGERKPSGVAAEVRVSFEEETETKLTLVAAKLAEAQRREKWYYFCNRWIVICLASTIIAFALVFPCVLFDIEAVQYCAFVALGIGAIGLVLAAVLFISCHLCQEWLRNDATTLSTTEALQEEFEEPEDKK